MMVIPTTFEATDKQSLQRKLDSTRKPVVLYFTEPNSNLCQLLDSEIDKVAGRHTGTFEFLAIDINEHKDLSYELQVMRCPSFIIFRNGEEIRRKTDVDYSEDFASEFRDFLLGDFHFDYEKFQILDAMNFSARLGAGFQMDVVSFMKPAQPDNWELIKGLKRLRERHQNKAMFSLVNAYTDSKIMDQFKIDDLPSVLAFHESSVVKRWVPVENLKSFTRECNQLIE